MPGNNNMPSQSKKRFYNITKRIRSLVVIFPLLLPATLMAEIGIDYSNLGKKIDLNIPFIDEAGNNVTLGELSGNRPIVLALVYYKCTSICSPFLNGIAKMIDQSPLYFLPGNSYSLVTLSFNHLEDHELAFAKKANYIANLKNPGNINKDEWHFLTSNKSGIEKITKQVGFFFEKDGDAFKHASTLIVISPTGKISRYIRGIKILPIDLMMAVTDAREDKWAPTVKKFVKLCFVKDPEGKGYYFDFLKITGILMLITIFGGIGLLTFLVRKKTTT